jgi:hypothetical protein
MIRENLAKIRANANQFALITVVMRGVITLDVVLLKMVKWFALIKTL